MINRRFQEEASPDGGDGSGQNTDDNNTDSTDVNGDGSGEEENASSEPGSESETEEIPAEGEEASDDTTPDETPEEPEEKPTFKYQDMEVDVEFPEELKASFEEKGIDSDKLIEELFSDGKFELSEATRKELDDAFGPTIVDGYLNLYKQQNDMAVKAHEQGKVDAEASHESFVKEFDEHVGGDDGWKAITDYAAESLDDTQIASMNAVMDLGPEHWGVQKTVIDAIKMQMDLNADREGTLVGQLGNGADESRGHVSPESKGYLSADEYSHIMTAEDLFDARAVSRDVTKKARVAQLDSLRATGIRKAK